MSTHDSPVPPHELRPITIREVARQAQVSEATVSRVLNGAPNVDPQLAKRVQSTMTRLKYRPSKVARALAGRSTLTLLGLLVTDLQNPFFIDIIRGVEEVTQKHNYLLIMCNTLEDPLKEAHYLKVLAEEPLAGIIIVPTSEYVQELELFKTQHIPIIIVDRHIYDRTIDTVIINNVAAAKEATAHLISNGYRRIGIISGPKFLINFNERILGYQQALQEAGIAFDPALEQHGSLINAEENLQLAKTLLECDPPIDAILATNNRLTVGALRAFRALHKRVPEDIALVGFDELPQDLFDFETPITTVMQPATELGRAAANRFLQRREDPESPRQEIWLQHQLRVRASSGPRQKASVDRNTI